MSENARVASFLDAYGNQVTINGSNVTYLQEYEKVSTIIHFGREHMILVKSPLKIVERDLFPERLWAEK